MKKITHVFAALMSVLWAIYQYPGVTDAFNVFLHAHPHLASVVALGISLFALYHNPSGKK